ncbi:bacteriohemerythrin [Pseudomonadota bacterium]
MLEWSSIFSTDIELVDTQHQRLFDMVNEVTEEINQGQESEKVFDEALDNLIAYSEQHFTDEELLMTKHKLDEKYLALHRMEHHSFVYDVNHMRSQLAIDNELTERFEKLVLFVTNWLIYHTLRMDQLMAIQMKAIEAGKTPAQAYEIAQQTTPNPQVTKLILDALIHLWGEAIGRIHHLETLLAQQQPKPGS